MARPIKNGLAYFPLDVDFFSDKKIKRLRAEFGTDGVAVYLYLLCEIYRNGYYAEYDDDLILDVSAELNISKNATTQIMNYLFSRSLLQCILADPVKVVTAASIQRRYQEAKKGGKREICVDGRLWVLKENETQSLIKVRPVDVFSENNRSFSENNTDRSENNSAKKSKVKKSKEKHYSTETDGEAAACTVTVTDTDKAERVLELYHRICRSYPRIELKEGHIRDIKDSLTVHTLDDFRTAFEKMESSSFLKGKNEKGWKAQFGWAVKRKNLEKLVSGHYEKWETVTDSAAFDISKYNVVINKFD